MTKHKVNIQKKYLYQGKEVRIFGSHRVSETSPWFTRVGYQADHGPVIKWVPAWEVGTVDPVNDFGVFVYEVLKASDVDRWPSFTSGLRKVIRGSYSDSIPLDYSAETTFKGVKVFCKPGVSNKGVPWSERKPQPHRFGFVCPLCQRSIPAGRLAQHMKREDHVKVMEDVTLSSLEEHVRTMRKQKEEERNKLGKLCYPDQEAEWLSALPKAGA
jgi:hypothetical protein